MMMNDVVKIRLREDRLVAFVMAVPAIAIHVNDDVAMELLPELERDLCNPRDRERIVAVYMENRCLDHLRDIARVARRTRVCGQRGEADLVINDNMNSSAGFIAG